MTIREVIKRRNLTVHDLYMEIETREEYGEFVHMCLMEFSDEDIQAEIDRMEEEDKQA